MQRFFAFILLLTVFPILLLVGIVTILVEWQSPIFLQARRGRNYKPFTIVKLRTMKNGKITFLGKVWRKTGIDELTQLINIVKGDMSFVGPRPLTEYDIERLEWNKPEHNVRWKVKPGITGLAQLVNVCDKDVSWQNDIDYISRKSVSLDIRILTRSALVPLLGKKQAKSILHKAKA